MNTGVIQKISDKGFGFIKVNGLAKAIFFHASGLIDVAFNDLKVGDRVVFEEIEATDKGSKAVGISLEE